MLGEMYGWVDEVLHEQTELLEEFSQLATLQAEERKVLETITPEDEDTRRKLDQLTQVVEQLTLTTEELKQELNETKEKLATVEAWQMVRS